MQFIKPCRYFQIIQFTYELIVEENIWQTFVLSTTNGYCICFVEGAEV